MRVLIVDDDRASRVLLGKALAHLGEGVAVGSGQEAVEAFAAALAAGTPFGLVSLDIIMPGLDGQATLTAMRELERKHGVAPGGEAKVMMVTALGDTGNVTRAFFTGQADAYVTKPLRQENIAKALREMGCGSD